MRKARASVTIADVAARAGVSVGTVSRVLGNAENCGPEVRRRVREAVEALDYVPTHAARSLKRRLTEQIALVIPSIANPVYVQMAVGVQREAEARGYHLTLVSTDGDAHEERRALEGVVQHQVDGAIVCSLEVPSTFVTAVEAVAERICVIGQLPLDAPVDNVRVDSRAGVALAIEHLLDTGRRGIAFINGTRGTVPALARTDGFRRALVDRGATVEERWLVEADFSMRGGYEAAHRLLTDAPDFDALFCANDTMALGALRRLHEAGRAVPRDVAVVGMDDIDAARVTSPTLTSVSLLAKERGRLAAELLLGRLTSDATPLEPRKVTVEPKLIVRESSAPA